MILEITSILGIHVRILWIKGLFRNRYKRIAWLNASWLNANTPQSISSFYKRAGMLLLSDAVSG
ncbi:hypothetical protein [Dyadobacter arcticus]|uniref:Uncharacterized protein n=1 Tax=Dyadobacter arcticus TaxID=1078754 RepID=A0ABX0UFZ9_9BACT|nr:hypothetical protein [Dyadobacter arcticus]NIJ51014.1 hypothetical protein [Dyadobacter arcticus]